MVNLIHLSGFALCLTGSLAKTILLLGGRVTPSRARQIDILNKITAAAAGISVLSGVALLFGMGRPAAEYLTQGIFIGKLALFVLISALVLSVKPFFRAAALAKTETTVPAKVRLFLLADLIGLPLIAAVGHWVATH